MPLSRFLIYVFMSCQVAQVASFLVIGCFANSLSFTVSVFKAFVIFVFTQFTFEKILSTHADECGKMVKFVVK